MSQPIPDYVKRLPTRERLLAVAKWRREHPEAEATANAPQKRVVEPVRSGAETGTNGTSAARTYISSYVHDVVEEGEPNPRKRAIYEQTALAPFGHRAAGAPGRRSAIHAADGLAEIDGRSYGKIVRSLVARFGVHERKAKAFLRDAVTAGVAVVDATGPGRASFYSLTPRGIRYRDTPNPFWRNNLRAREANKRRSDAAMSEFTV